MVILGNAELLEQAFNEQDRDFSFKGANLCVTHSGCRQPMQADPDNPPKHTDPKSQAEKQGRLWVIDDDPELLEVIGELLDEL